MKNREKNAEKKLTPLLVIFAFVILITMILISVQRMRLENRFGGGGDPLDGLDMSEALEKEDAELIDYGLTPLSVFIRNPDYGDFPVDGFEQISLVPDYRKTIQAVWVDMGMGNFASAEKTLRKLAVSYPQAADIIMTLGDVCYQQGKYQEAEQFYREQLKIFPDDPTILNHIAVCQIYQKNYIDALANMNRIVVLLPDAGEPLLNLAVIYESMGNREQAVRYVLKAYDKLGQSLAELTRSDFFAPLKQEPELAKILGVSTESESKTRNPEAGSEEIK